MTRGRFLKFSGAAVVGVVGLGAIATYPSLTTRRPTLGDNPRLQNRIEAIAKATSDPSALPTREAALRNLAAGTKEDPFDVLVIGGGATGSAVALDAASRGMRVALVERNDFASETSSKSTKLIHGGVRYLEKAVMGGDLKQLKLVYEALGERSIMLRQAPHLCHTLPTVVPCYSYGDAVFYWAGMKAYDVLAAFGGAMLAPSKFIDAASTLEVLPTLRRERATEPRSPLVGSVVYYDGSMNDARLNLGAALTAAALGSTVVNYCSVTKIEPQGARGKPLTTVTVRDERTGAIVNVATRLVVLAAGPFTDRVLDMIADPTQPAGEAKAPAKTVLPSAGSHVTFPEYLTRPANPSAEKVALLVPRTSDGRVLFVAPWCGATIAGTTDRLVQDIDNPTATGDDIKFVLDSVSEAFDVKMTNADVTSVWCGIRPLAATFSGKGATQSVVREHRILNTGNGIVSVTGGKWTTFRRMGFDTMEALLHSNVDPELTERYVKRTTATQSLSAKLPFVGSPRWSDDSWHKGAADFGRLCQRHGVPSDVENHLWSTYGLRAGHVLSIAAQLQRSNDSPASFTQTTAAKPAAPSSSGGWFGGSKKQAAPVAVESAVEPDGNGAAFDRLLPTSAPLLSAEVLYACRYEMCVTPADFLCRRTRLAFTDARAAVSALPKVTALLASEQRWSPERAMEEKAKALALLKTFVPPPAATPLEAAHSRMQGQATLNSGAA